MAEDAGHFKVTADPDEGSYVVRRCVDGGWKLIDEPLPVPTDLVEDGPGAGPRHCPVCAGDAISSLHL